MDTLNLRDRVRGLEERITVDLTSTVDDVIDVVVTDLGLPQLTAGGDRIVYELRSEAGDALPGAADLAGLGLAEGSSVDLISAEGEAAWERVRDLVGQLRTEVEAGGRRVVDTARREIRQESERVTGAIQEEVRAVVRETTQDIEAEISRRIRGFGRRFGLWSRRRIRRLVREITKTGALPQEMEALSLASGRLGAVAQTALVVPLAGAVAVTAAVAVYGVATGDPAPGDPAPTDLSGIVAELAEVRELANSARAAADDAQRTADFASAAARAHVEDQDNPHGVAVEVLDIVDRHVRESLVAEGEDAAPDTPWVGAVLAAADGRAGRQVDRHLSTEYATAGATVEVAAGDSLWTIATRTLQRSGAYDHGCDPVGAVENPTAEEVISYIARLWVANVGVVRDDPGVLEVGSTLQLVCPGPGS